MTNAVRVETMYAGTHVTVIPLDHGIALGVTDESYIEVYLYPSQILKLVAALANAGIEVRDV